MNNDKFSDKISAPEWFLLAMLFVCYIGSLCFMIIDNRILLILFFILHSCLALVLLLLLHGKLMAQTQKQTDNIFRQLEDDRETISKYSNEIAVLTQEKESLIKDKELISVKYSDAEKRAATLANSLEQEKLFHEQVPENVNLNHLLPQDENPVNLDIIASARHVIEEMTPYSQRAGIHVALSSSNNKLMVRADAGFIRILFRNIIDNSIKYMHRRGSLVITISNIGDDLFIVLKDNGEGLSSNETTRIFELNYQGSNRVSGNGLGLTQAKAIVEYYGGTIYAKSERGKGMGVYIQLPASSR